MYADIRMKTRRAIPIADQLAVLGEAVRLRMLRLLETSELSVGEVGRVLQMAQSTASRHLKALADTGWISKRTEGPATLYRVVLDDLQTTARATWLAIRDQAAPAADLAEDQERLAAVLSERRTDSEAFFGRVAGQWDAVRSQLFGDRFTPAALMGFMPRSWTIADLGCGTGDAAELLAPLVARVLAVDSSEPMLSAARQRLRGVRNVEFVKADLDAMPIEAASVDAAVMVLVLHHLADPASALRESRRILRTNPSGGGLMVIDMIAHDRADYRQTMGHKHLGFTRASLDALARGAGFTEIEYRELPREPEAKGPGLFVATLRG
jgi:ubiquinone/menaquinone biosynthesis C-methylase UbiE/DNA-binding transcriptional ArsR family regulator